MKARSSEIKLESFAVLQSHYKFIPPKRNPKDLNKLFQRYEIDIDFAHQMNEDETIQVFTKISINKTEKPLPGYQLFAEGAGVFILEENPGLSEAEINNLKYYSTVSILIGYLRNTLSALTASAPFMPYLLPPIDMSDLFKNKAEKK